MTPTNPVPATQEMPCETCGRPEAVRVADRWLCEACYSEAGACCADAPPEAD